MDDRRREAVQVRHAARQVARQAQLAPPREQRRAGGLGARADEQPMERAALAQLREEPRRVALLAAEPEEADDVRVREPRHQRRLARQLRREPLLLPRRQPRGAAQLLDGDGDELVAVPPQRGVDGAKRALAEHATERQLPLRHQQPERHDAHSVPRDQLHLRPDVRRHHEQQRRQRLGCIVPEVLGASAPSTLRVEGGGDEACRAEGQVHAHRAQRQCRAQRTRAAPAAAPRLWRHAQLPQLQRRHRKEGGARDALEGRDGEIVAALLKRQACGLAEVAPLRRLATRGPLRLEEGGGEGAHDHEDAGQQQEARAASQPDHRHLCGYGIAVTCGATHLLEEEHQQGEGRPVAGGSDGVEEDHQCLPEVPQVDVGRADEIRVHGRERDRTR